MEKYDVVIIGGGPGGLTAAIYASRANKKTLFIEKGAPGGKMVKTALIENWSGDTQVNGPDLSMRMFEHAKAYGATYKYGVVENVKHLGDYDHEVILESGEVIPAKAVIIATGMVERVPEWIENIHKFENKGVSYCAICDGPIFKGRNVAVIGGGNSAVEESIYLSSVASKVYVIVKFGFQADKKALDELKTKENVEIIEEAEVTKLIGENKLEKAIVKSKDGEKEIEISGFFPYIGFLPTTSFVKDLDITDKTGFIPTNELMETSKKGIFAIGDIRVKAIRQISTAVADGTIAGKIVANEI